MTGLSPLTDAAPKALAKILGPMFEHLFDYGIRKR
jgi:NDP-sugar pyrophosphorylase family protein